MITEIAWSHIILESGGGGGVTGYRVKRRKDANGQPYLPPVVASGVDHPKANSWASPPAPDTINYQNRDYVLAFWSVSAVDTTPPYQSSAQIQAGNVANDSHVGGNWRVTAKAYYVWNQGGGGGDHALLIDAFDINAQDFLGDDFVTADPDPNGTLIVAANDGYINTSTQIAKSIDLRIGAVDIPRVKVGFEFIYWFPVKALTHSNDPKEPVTIGSPVPRDIHVHFNDIAVAFAFYQPGASVRLPSDDWATHDPWWWLKTHGGLLPPGPLPVWLREYSIALALAEASNRMQPHLKEKVLKVALEQVAETAARLEEALKTIGRK